MPVNSPIKKDKKMYRISETLRFPIGYVSYKDHYTPADNLILAANDFFCSGIVGYTAFLSGNRTKRTSKTSLETNQEVEPKEDIYSTLFPIQRHNVTGKAWCDALEYKEKNVFGLCEPEILNKYSAERNDYNKILKLVEDTIGYKQHCDLLEEFIDVYPDKKDKVVCVLPKSIINITNLGDFAGTSQDYYLVKEVLCALSYIAAGCEPTNKCSVSLSAGRLLLEWRLMENNIDNNVDDSEEWSFLKPMLNRHINNAINNGVNNGVINGVYATGYLASQEYIEDAFSRILQEYSLKVSTEELSKYKVAEDYKGTVVTNFNLGIDSEHLYFNDFSFLNALSIVKRWEETKGINLGLDNLESDYYQARERAIYIEDVL
jgi:hypothetical protein